MGHPSQRVPVALFGRSGRPTNRAPSQTGAHMGVLSYIAVIVIVHERMPADRVVKRQRQHGQQQAQHVIALLGRRKCSRGLRRKRFFLWTRQCVNLTTAAEGITEEEARKALWQERVPARSI